MGTKAEALRELRTVLAKLFTRTADAIRIAEDAGLNLAFIQLDAASINTWRSILSEADKRNKIKAIIAVAISDYPESPELEQARQAYLDATSIGRESKGRLRSKIEVRQPPPIDMEDFQSVLFQQHGGSSLVGPAAAEPTLPIEAVCDLWDDGASSTSPLIVVLDFALDVQQTMLAVSTELGPAHWVDGEVLLGARTKKYHQTANSTIDLAESPPSLLLVDFSEIRPEAVLDGTADPNPSTPAETLADFCALALNYGHKIVLGFPRFMRSLVNVEQISYDNSYIYTAATLFSSRYRYRVDQCQKLLSKTRSEGNLSRLLDRQKIGGGVLPPLLSANSNALPLVAGEFLASLPKNANLDVSLDNPSNLSLLLELANKLTARGFYEIAFRLEVYCRTLEQQRGIDLVSLQADVDLEPQNKNSAEKIVGLLEGLEKTPSITHRVALSGEPGSGKTMALLQMERFWSLPQTSVDGLNHPHWVPLSMVVSQGSDLEAQLQDYFRENRYLAVGSRRRPYSLACHTLFAKVATGANLRWLLSSPLYFLFDGIDELGVEQQLLLDEALRNLTETLPDAGALLAHRSGEAPQFADLPNVRLRSMSNHQLEAFLRAKGRQQAWRGLVGVNDKRIAQHLRNPYLLNLICSLASFQQKEIENLNLHGIFQAYIDQVTGKVRPAIAHQMSEEWLPPLALRMKIEGLSTIEPEGDRALEFITYGRQMGLLRGQPGDSSVRFQGRLLRDYFAAKRMVQEIDQQGVSTIIARHLAQNKAYHAWETVFKVLSGLLKTEQAKELIEYISRNVDLQLAHECMLEVSKDRYRAIGKEISRRLVRQIGNFAGTDIQGKVKEAEALGFLDPRIFPDAPLQGMVDIEGSGGISDFKIGRYPLTNMEFARFVEAGGYAERTWWDDAGWRWLRQENIKHPRYWYNRELNKPNCPIVGISFFETLAYCRWLSTAHPGYLFMPPSATQWDGAAHSGDTDFDQLLKTLRMLSRTADDVGLLLLELEQEHVIPRYAEEMETLISRRIISHIHNYMALHRPQLEYGALTPVGIFPPNAQGCFDLFGNVWEWCSSWLSSDEEDEAVSLTASLRPGDSIIVKGGAWAGTYNPVWSLMDGWFDPYVRFHELGFRICAVAAAG